MGVRLVGECQVVEGALVVHEHRLRPVLQNHCQLVGEAGVVGAAARDHRGEDVTVAIVVLESLAGENRASAGRAPRFFGLKEAGHGWEQPESETLRGLYTKVL